MLNDGHNWQRLEAVEHPAAESRFGTGAAGGEAPAATIHRRGRSNHGLSGPLSASPLAISASNSRMLRLRSVIASADMFTPFERRVRAPVSNMSLINQHRPQIAPALNDFGLDSHALSIQPPASGRDV